MRTRRLAAGLVVGAFVLVGLAVPPTHAGSPPAALDDDTIADSAPDAWARACNAGNLNLGPSALDLAPVLADDKAPGGGLITRTPDSRGRYVPVIFVHGWNSKDTHEGERTGTFSHKIDLEANVFGTVTPARSLIGQIQNLPGAVAFTYDYRESSGRWVTNDPIGPGLGRAIDCLFRASGEKVVIISHSMGGLAARQAIGKQKDGSDRANEVSTVVTFGTPNTGSFAATLGGALAGGNAPYSLETALHLIVSTCEDLTDTAAPGTTCAYLPQFVGILGGEAATAMKIGSSELRALPQLPRSVNLVAEAGRTKLAIPKVGLFALPWETEDVDMGDLIVGADSALPAYADSSRSISCRYQLSAVRGATDQVGLVFGQTSKGDVAQSPLKLFEPTCFHSNLMRTLELTTDALGAVNEDITARQNDHGKAPQLGIPARERDDAAGTRTPIEVVLDRSGSMTETVASGIGAGTTVKIDAAKAAVIDLIDKSDPGQELGIVAYPGGSGLIENCESGVELIPLRPVDKNSAENAVRGLKADGGTPTSAALFHAAEIMQRRGSMTGVIVLVSDGESNCGETPVCDTAQALRDRGFELTVNSVGFDIAEDSAAAEELRCVADATGGEYLQASDAEALREQILKAAGASVAIEADVPAQISTVVGGGSSGDTGVQVSVTNDSRLNATDVRVALDFVGKDGVGGAVLVTRPVRFLGNLAPGITRSVTFQVHPDPSLEGETLDWHATVTSRNGAANIDSGKAAFVRSDPSQVAGVLQGVEHPVILGDSYSSGEGGGDYLPGTDDKEKGTMCHRSPATYGLVLFPDASLIACSGAVTGNFYSEQDSGQGAEAQLAALRKQMASSTPPDGVFLTLGGNDIGFSSVIKECTTSPRCSWSDYSPQGWAGTTTIDHNNKLLEIYALEPELRTIYRQIDEIVNAPDAVRDRGREAPVVVLPYARITPHDETGISGCAAGINKRELPFLNSVLDTLDQTISLAVLQEARRARPIYYASDVQEAMQPNHTICDGTASYAVRATVGEVPGRVSEDSKKQELMHPNAQGYKAIATALSNWSRATTPRKTTPLRGEGELDLPANGTLAKAWSAVTRSGIGPLREPGSTASISAAGFAPGTRAVVWLESYPTPLGSATVDASGSVHTDVRLPKSLSRGKHHLVTVGTAPDGSLQTVSRPIRVVPVLGFEAVLGVLIGLGLVLLGLRRRRNALAQGPGTLVSDFR